MEPSTQRKSVDYSALEGPRSPLGTSPPKESVFPLSPAIQRPPKMVLKRSSSGRHYPIPPNLVTTNTTTKPTPPGALSPTTPSNPHMNRLKSPGPVVTISPTTAARSIFSFDGKLPSPTVPGGGLFTEESATSPDAPPPPPPPTPASASGLRVSTFTPLKVNTVQQDGPTDPDSPSVLTPISRIFHSLAADATAPIMPSANTNNNSAPKSPTMLTPVSRIFNSLNNPDLMDTTVDYVLGNFMDTINDIAAENGTMQQQQQIISIQRMLSSGSNSGSVGDVSGLNGSGVVDIFVGSSGMGGTNVAQDFSEYLANAIYDIPGAVGSFDAFHSQQQQQQDQMFPDGYGVYGYPGHMYTSPFAQQQFQSIYSTSPRDYQSIQSPPQIHVSPATPQSYPHPQHQQSQEPSLHLGKPITNLTSSTSTYPQNKSITSFLINKITNQNKPTISSPLTSLQPDSPHSSVDGLSPPTPQQLRSLPPSLASSGPSTESAASFMDSQNPYLGNRANSTASLHPYRPPGPRSPLSYVPQSHHESLPYSEGHQHQLPPRKQSAPSSTSASSHQPPLVLKCHVADCKKSFKLQDSLTAHMIAAHGLTPPGSSHPVKRFGSGESTDSATTSSPIDNGAVSTGGLVSADPHQDSAASSSGPKLALKCDKCDQTFSRSHGKVSSIKIVHPYDC
ncbi:UNVERIFIED_CONTAM: hypothetical protein HDU68_002375 [Siphonaria sp. JEL0065]|nr:hypothetical protein HDU68_002375 [Siphonaria sp. JEL0065]